MWYSTCDSADVHSRLPDNVFFVPTTSVSSTTVQRDDNTTRQIPKTIFNNIFIFKVSITLSGCKLLRQEEIPYKIHRRPKYPRLPRCTHNGMTDLKKMTALDKFTEQKCFMLLLTEITQLRQSEQVLFNSLASH